MLASTTLFGSECVISRLLRYSHWHNTGTTLETDMGAIILNSIFLNLGI